MKRIVAMIVLCASIHVYGQSDAWYGVDLGRVGYKHNFFSTNIGAYDMQFDGASSASKNYAYEYTYYSGVEMNIASPDLTFEIYSPGVYFMLDCSILGIALQAILAKERIKEKTTFDRINIDVIEAIPTRLYFGGMFAKYFGFYAGGQYQYSVYTSKSLDFADHSADRAIGNPLVLGGNQYGFGAQGLVGTERFLLKYTYMYDWIGRLKTNFKGRATSQEISLLVPLGSSKFGIAARYNWRNRIMHAGWLPKPKDYNDFDKGFNLYVPEFRGADYSFTLGIFMEGLLSGTTRTITQTVKVL